MFGLDTIAGIGLGLGTASWQDERQLAQQRNLQNIAIEGQQTMGEFNEGLAIDQWQKTGPVGQMAQLQKAGLNPGLMYSGGGGGGGTASVNNGSIGNANAQGGVNEIPTMMGMGLMGAQQENIKADTKKKEVEADVLGGATKANIMANTDKTMADMKKVGQETNNLEVQNGILEYEKQTKEVEANIAKSTQKDVISMVGKNLESLQQTIEQQVTNNKVTRENADQLIIQAQQNTVEQQLRMGAIKAGIINTEANTANTNQNTKVQQQEIDNMKMVVHNLWQEYGASKQEQERQWLKMSQKDQEIAIGKELADFGTNDAAHIKQWTSIITDVIESLGISKWLGGKGTAPAAGQQGVRDSKGRLQPRGWTDVLK